MNNKKLTAIILLSLVGLIPSGYSAAETDADKAMLKSIADDDIKQFKKIIDQGYDVNSFVDNADKNWLLCDTTRPGRIELLKYAIEAGGDVNRLREPDITLTATPLRCAVFYGNNEAFDYLLSKGADPAVNPCSNCKPDTPYTLLVQALFGDRFQIAYKLLSRVEITPGDIRALVIALQESRYLEIYEENSEEKYRLKLAEFLKDEGYTINLWTPEKEKSGEWLGKRKRDRQDKSYHWFDNR